MRTSGRELAAVPVTERGILKGEIALAPQGGWGFDHPQEPDPLPEDETEAWIKPVTAGYLEAAGIGVVQGRGIEASDVPGALPVALVNQTFIDQNFPGEDPIGKEVHVSVTFGFGSPTWTIVGVVPDIRSSSLREDPNPEIYVPQAQMGPGSMTVVVRSASGAPPLLPAIRAEVQAMDTVSVTIGSTRSFIGQGRR